MANYRTAMGKAVDMATLVKRNEQTRAVGNMSVNARGDTIDSQGRVIVPVTEKVNDAYSKTVGNRSAQVKPRTPPPEQPKIDTSQLNEIELELENPEEDDEIEQIKAAELKKGKK